MAGCGVLTILTQFVVVLSLFASLRSCIKLCDVVCKFTGIDVKLLLFNFIYINFTISRSMQLFSYRIGFTEKVILSICNIVIIR